jgi:hypothetical protein
MIKLAHNGKNSSYVLYKLIGKYFLQDDENNDIKNLEWITKSNNTIHSCGKKIDQVDKDRNEIIKIYTTLKAAMQAMGKKMILKYQKFVIIKIINSHVDN